MRQRLNDGSFPPIPEDVELPSMTLHGTNGELRLRKLIGLLDVHEGIVHELYDPHTAITKFPSMECALLGLMA
jgi:hypothetical protein